MTKSICVITGGGSGMGLATAKVLGMAHHVLLVGRNAGKLDSAASELKALGIEAEAYACDIAHQASVEKLATYARHLGKVADVRTILEANALGTLNVNNAFFEVMERGSCLIDVASISGHLVPTMVLPTRAYPLCRTDHGKFLRKLQNRAFLFPKKLRSAVAYGISKHFGIWLARNDAARFGTKGIRILSVSPGNFETPMGELERDEANKYTQQQAIKRFGDVDEIAHLLAHCSDPRLGYLTGTDIVCDGGCVASRKA
jgi:NAD(P)-dependent dehydrogenase (short-subunit alcohol dehydrogenase family)